MSLIVTTPSVIAVARGRDAYSRSCRMTMRFGLSGVGYLTVIAAGVLLLVSLASTFVWVIVIAIVLLLLISLRDTWDLLVTVGEQMLGTEKNKD